MPRERRLTIGLGACLAFVCLGLYLWAVDFQPLDLDDPAHVFTNPWMHPPTFASLVHFWTKPFFSMYIPVTYTAWMAIAALFGQGGTLPGGPFHLLNVLLHVGNVLLVYSLLLSWLEVSRVDEAHERPARETIAAALGAAIFAVHPVQVETVAWISALRDLLSTFFSLLALRFYVSASPRRGLALAAFVVALLSKPSAAILPAMALVLEVTLLDEKWRASLARLAPALGLGALTLGLAKYLQPDTQLRFLPPFWARPLIATDSLAFYLYKLVFPFLSAFDYGRNPERVLSEGWLYYTWLAPAVAGFFAWRAARRLRAVTAAVAVFVLGLLPILGLVSFDFQIFSTVCDHYLYLPMLGVALGVALAVRAARARWLIPALGFCLVMAAVTTERDLFHWQSTIALARHSFEVNPESALMVTNLGAALMEEHQFHEAELVYARALELRPDEASLRAVLANAIFQQGRAAEAWPLVEAALRSDPRLSIALLTGAQIKEALGDRAGAAALLERELAIQPGNAYARHFLSELQGAAPRATASGAP